MSPDGEQQARVPALFVVAGLALAAIAVPVAAAAGPAYLSLGRLNPGLIVFAVGLFAALFAAPFAIHRRLGGTLEADARWERALLLWGAVATAILVLGLLCGLAAGFGSDSLAGSLGLVAMIEAGLVLGTLVVWLISG